MVANQIDRQRVETLGPAERIIQALTTYTDHAVHNRPGFIVPDGRTKTGVNWYPVTWKEENGQKVVYRLDKTVKNKETRTRVGILDGVRIMENGRQVGEYRKPGLFPEVATWLYRQVAEVFKLDNEFAAHWGSWAFSKDHRDMKVILAAFLLVQNRCGEPVVEDGKVLFYDEDFRDVGEAMCLIRAKGDIDPKLLLRVGDILSLPGVAAINRELGFGKSARTPAKGRYYKAVEKYLRYREDNPKMLEGLVGAGFRTSVMELARRVGYKPSTPKFFETLRWKQAQAKDGRRQVAIGTEVKKAETWKDFSEKEICERIIATKPNYKRIVGMLPAEVGLTRAIMMAAIEAGSVSDADLVILTPTLEELGLLTVKEVANRWKKATEAAENQRATNIAKRVKNQATREMLQDASDNVAKKAMEEVTKDLRIYTVVDKCVVGDTILATTQGLIPIAALGPQFHTGELESDLDLQVATRDGIGHASKLYVNGVREIRRIVTTKGYRLGASLNHPVLIYDPHTCEMDWKHAGSVSVGDWAVLRRGTHCFGKDRNFSYKAKTPYQPCEEGRGWLPITMSSDFGRWLGYVVSEGRLKYRPAIVEFVNSDKEMRDDFVNLTKRLFGLDCRIIDVDAETVGISSETVLNFLNSVTGLRPNRSRDKTVPFCVLSSSEESQRQFLRSYFSGDGGFMCRKSGTLCASSASFELLQTIQIMLLNFGIISKLQPTTSLATNGKRIRREYWRLYIGGNDRLLFLEKIGFSSTVKQKVVYAAVMAHKNSTWSTRWDFVPAIINGVLHKFGHHSEVSKLGTPDKIKTIIENGFLIDAVAVSMNEPAEMMYDINVSKQHSFIGNGFINHNSGSMQGAIEQAKVYLTKLLVGFPLDKLHCSIFNTVGGEVVIKHPSAKGIEAAFRGHFAGGGTSYAEGVKALMKHKPKDGEDTIIIFVGDELDHGTVQLINAVNNSGIRPVAFGLLKVMSQQYGSGSVVRDAARQLNIPCFEVEEGIFSDPYAVTRVLRNLIANTPVVAEARRAVAKKTLVEEILGTSLLKRPVWA
jgi:intein/homing endonuclease